MNQNTNDHLMTILAPLSESAHVKSELRLLCAIYRAREVAYKIDLATVFSERVLRVPAVENPDKI